MNTEATTTTPEPTPLFAPEDIQKVTNAVAAYDKVATTIRSASLAALTAWAPSSIDVAQVVDTYAAANGEDNAPLSDRSCHERLKAQMSITFELTTFQRIIKIGRYMVHHGNPAEQVTRFGEAVWTPPTHTKAEGEGVPQPIQNPASMQALAQWCTDRNTDAGRKLVWVSDEDKTTEYSDAGVVMTRKKYEERCMTPAQRAEAKITGEFKFSAVFGDRFRDETVRQYHNAYDWSQFREQAGISVDEWEGFAAGVVAEQLRIEEEKEKREKEAREEQAKELAKKDPQQYMGEQLKLLKAAGQNDLAAAMEAAMAAASA